MVVFQQEKTRSEYEPENTGLVSLSRPSHLLIHGSFLLEALMRNISSLFNGGFWICETHTGSAPVVSEGSSNATLCRRGGGRKFFTRHVGLFLSKRDSPLPHCQQRFSSDDVSLGLCAPAPCQWQRETLSPVFYTLKYLLLLFYSLSLLQPFQGPGMNRNPSVPNLLWKQKKTQTILL